MTDQYFRPRNWDRHQGWRKRGATWVKNYTALLTDPEYLELTPPARAVLHGIWLLCGQHGRSLPLSSSYLGQRMAIRSQTVGHVLGTLLSSNFIELCEKSVALYSQDSSVTKSEDIDESRVEPPYIPPKGKRTILTDLADWTPSSEDRAYAEQHNLDPERVLTDIHDWAANAAASKRRKKDPSRFWQTWCRREADRPRPQIRQNGAGPPGLIQMANKLIEKHRGLENGHLRQDCEGTDETESCDPPALPGPGEF